MEFLYKTNALEQKFPSSDPQFLKIKLDCFKKQIQSKMCFLPAGSNQIRVTAKN